AESARAAAGADAACIMLADEDGELRLCGASGTVPDGQAPSALTVPFMVEGRVTGLLAVTAAAAGALRDGTATALLTELADRACDGAHVTSQPAQGQLPEGRLPPAGGQPRPAWRWPLSGPAGCAGAPPGAASLAADTAWCFPFTVPAGLPGVLAVGSGYRRL